MAPAVLPVLLLALICPRAALGKFEETCEEARCPGLVIVVGAGLAGLVAAQTLRQAQCQVLVLEAGGDVGGRARVIESGPFQGLQAGAQWIHGGVENEVMMALLRSYNISAERVGGDTNFEGDDEKHQLHEQPAMKHKAMEVFAEANRIFEDLAVVRAQKQDVSLRDVWDSVLAQFPRSKELLEWQLRVRSEQNWAVPDRDVGVRLAELATYRDSSPPEPNRGGDLRFQSKSLLRHLVEGLDIHLRTEVKAIHLQGEEVAEAVVVETSSEIVRGAAVIVTCSLAVLQAGLIRFFPPMDAAWMEALGRFQMGRVVKIFIRFAGQCPVGPNTYLLSRLVNRSSERLLYYCIREASDTLVCLVGGPSAKVAEAAPPSLLHALVLAELQEMYPRSTLNVSVHLASFAQDPFVLGSWSSGRLGASSGDFEIYRARARQGLIFAGEHTCRLMYGTLQAAASSGARAAHTALGLSASSPCDELDAAERRDLCGGDCRSIWRQLAMRVPSHFSSWSGMPAEIHSCWSGMGWSEVSWTGRGRIPKCAQKPWKELRPEEQKSAQCVGYDQQLWDDFREDLADLILCRRGAPHFKLPWDCLEASMKEDWQQLGVTRPMLDEALPSPLEGKAFKRLRPEQTAAARRIGYRSWLW